MGLRVAVVQPLTNAPPDDGKNVADAVRYIEEAASKGARFVAFPESYPGPWRMPMTFDPAKEMIEAARRCDVYVQYNSLQPLGDNERNAYNIAALARPSGETPGIYRRTRPRGPWIYEGGAYWDFRYVPGDDYPTFETEYCRVGLGICSEVYVPEVTRILALRGAELIFLPAGLPKRRLWPTWRALIWARAIENLAIVVTTQNLMSKGETGLAMVATPEDVIFESTEPGLFIVDVDLPRVRDLRSTQDQIDSPDKSAAKAGILTAQWQRPELRGQPLAGENR